MSRLAFAALAVAPLLLAADPPPAGLVAHWPLAGDARDRGPAGLHATNRGADLSAAGPRDATKAAAFDGRAARLEVPADPRLDLGTSDFTIALWAKVTDHTDDLPGDLVSRYDASGKVGFSFGVATRAGVNHAQANVRQLYFGMDDGKHGPVWVDRGRPGKAIYVHALATHDGQLFAATCEPGKDEAGHVYRLDGSEWVDCGSPDKANAVTTLAAFGGKLYAGSGKYRVAGSALPESENTNAGGGIYRYDGDGKWAACGRLPDAVAVGALGEFRGKLYASSLYKPAGFFRYAGGEKWESLPTPNGLRVEALCPFNGSLFATCYDGGFVHRFDGETWHPCGELGAPKENTQTYGFAVYRGELYCGTWPSGKAYRYRGDNDWADVGRLGEELEVMGMATHNGGLYAGTLPLAGVYRYAGGTKWEDTGRVDITPGVKFRRAWSMAVYRGELYCGTLPSGRVWAMRAGRCVTHDRELTPGWHHLAAVRDGDRLRLYVDGKPVAESAAFDPKMFDLTSGGPLLIGDGPTDRWAGSLADVRLYRRALSAAELAALAAK